MFPFALLAIVSISIISATGTPLRGDSLSQKFKLSARDENIRVSKRGAQDDRTPLLMKRSNDSEAPVQKANPIKRLVATINLKRLGRSRQTHKAPEQLKNDPETTGGLSPSANEPVPEVVRVKTK